VKIVWRNPNLINRTSFSIMKTLAVEQRDELWVFYGSSRGPGNLAPYLSYWSIVTRFPLCGVIEMSTVCFL
jgi:hypothetical protein